MSKSIRTNIYQRLKDEFVVYDILIDIGCGKLHDLVNFEESQFKILVGVDKNFEYSPFKYYKKIKRVRYKEGLHEYFKNRYTIHEMDFLNYDFGHDCNSLIICNKVLHFYADYQKIEIISKLYRSLQKSGLLYLKINHNKNQNNIDPNNTLQIEKNVFENREVPKDIRYLVDADIYKDYLSNEFNVLEKYTMIDDRTLTLVIVKNL